MSPEKEDEVLPSVTHGWHGKVTGKYFNGRISALENQILDVVRAIKPQGRPDFIPTIFSMRPASSVRKRIGDFINFQRKDIQKWIPPSYEDQHQTDAPYYPAATLEAQAHLADRNTDHWPKINFASALLKPMEEIDPTQRIVLEGLTAAFQAAGHNVQDSPTLETNVMITPFDIPDGDEPLTDRIAIPGGTGRILNVRDAIQKLRILQIKKRYRLKAAKGELPTNLGNAIGITTITEDLRGLPHTEMEKIAWTTMTRTGVYKVMFVTKNPQTNEPLHITYSTMEGGRATIAHIDQDPQSAYEDIRDRLIVHGNCHKVEDSQRHENVITKKTWYQCKYADYLTNIFRELGKRGLVDKPINLTDFGIHPIVARFIKKKQGWDGQSTSAGIVFTPDLPLPSQYTDESDPHSKFTMILTATGTDETDKTDMHKQDGDVIAINIRDGQVHTYGVEGQTLKRDSVEAKELAMGLLSAGVVRLRKTENGYARDEKGDIEATLVKGALHLHRAVAKINPYEHNGTKTQVAEHIPIEWSKFPHPLGCGLDKMLEFAVNEISQAGTINPNAVVAIVDIPNHGIHLIMLNNHLPDEEEMPEDPFETVLKLIDQGIIELTDEIPSI